jgi:anhydro-N-acetylmuramic acid kinase
VSKAPVRLCAGLMSGTSVDAVDGVLAAFPLEDGPDAWLETLAFPRKDNPEARPETLASPFDGASGAPIRTLAFRSRSMPSGLREALQALQKPGADELARASEAANALADLYAEVVADLLETSGHRPGQVAAIGAHGQTVRHRPELGYTLQLLNPARLAERSGLAVVADLRSADLAAGGQGAPLVPAFHAQVFGDPFRKRAIVNLGGIANVSLIPSRAAAGHAARPRAGASRSAGPWPPELPEAGLSASDAGLSMPQVLGCDTGPANTLLDFWCRRHTGADFDADGAWAAGGRVLKPLLHCLLAEPYFRRPAPKSTGRDLFEATWLEARLRAAGATDASPRDVQATLAELTAVTVAQPCRAFGADEVWVCGGGARNVHLMRRIAEHTAPAPVADTAALGLDPLAVEATAFAWLAHRRLSGLPGNLPAVTGAAGPRVLGAVWPAPGAAGAAQGR